MITLGLRGGDSSQAYLSPQGIRSDMVSFRGSTYWWLVSCPALRLGEHFKLVAGKLVLHELAMQLEPCAGLYPSVMARRSASEGQQNV